MIDLLLFCRVEGTGRATITEVTSVERLEEKKKVDETEAKSCKEEISLLKKQQQVLEAEMERVAKLKTIVLGLGDNVTARPSTSGKEEVMSVY